MHVNVIALFLLVVEVAHVASSDWDYAKHGPDTWVKHFPKCGGTSQSPINIITCETSKSHFGNRVIQHNFWKKLKNAKYELVNNGHALQMNLPGDNSYRLTKANKKYRPLQVHIHFDTTTGKGSEHTLNSKRYFAEIHIVHANVKYNVSAKEYMNYPDGLLVVGMFADLVKGYKKNDAGLDFTFGAIDSAIKGPNMRTSFAMSLFGNSALELIKPDSKKEVNAFPLGWLLPTTPRKKAQLSYVNYKGSLTTPPCSEIVDWIVITGKTLEVNNDMAYNLAKVMNEQGTIMAGNFRPLKDLEDRDVYGVKGFF